MVKKLKIVILFVVLLIIVVSGWRMYRGLQYDKIVYETDIYAYVPPQSNELIHISRNYYFEQLYEYNSEFKFFLEATHKDLEYPIMISSQNNRNPLLLAKLNKEKSDEIERKLIKQIAPYYTPKYHSYKNTEIKSYALNDSSFINYANFHGIVALSKDFNVITDFIDTDLENNFFTSVLGKNTVYRLISNSPISIFMVVDKHLLAFDYSQGNTFMKLKGYALHRGYGESDSLGLDLTEKIKTPKNYFIDNFNVDTTKDVQEIRIELNKSSREVFINSDTN